MVASFGRTVFTFESFEQPVNIQRTWDYDSYYKKVRKNKH